MTRTQASTGQGNGSGDVIVPSGASEPAGVNGEMFINTSTDSLEIFYGGSWQVITVLSNGSFMLLQDNTYLLLQDGSYLQLNS